MHRPEELPIHCGWQNDSESTAVIEGHNRAGKQKGQASRPAPQWQRLGPAVD
jgi:hypothetical protein